MTPPGSGFEGPFHPGSWLRAWGHWESKSGPSEAAGWQLLSDLKVCVDDGLGRARAPLSGVGSRLWLAMHSASRPGGHGLLLLETRKLDLSIFPRGGPGVSNPFSSRLLRGVPQAPWP